ncbi:thermonuclease family protein [Microbacterium sp. NPDC055665]
MSHRHGGAVALVAVVALTGCTPTVLASTTEPVTETVEVIAAVDGDTIDVATGEGTARVRLIGIDTPEIGRGGEASECCAEEARSFLDDLLYRNQVYLVPDPTQADVDRYGRLLRHVLIDGRSAAELAIAAGAGYEYTYDVPYEGQGAHRDAQDVAAGRGVGLWSSCG